MAVREDQPRLRDATAPVVPAVDLRTGPGVPRDGAESSSVAALVGEAAAARFDDATRDRQRGGATWSVRTGLVSWFDGLPEPPSGRPAAKGQGVDTRPGAWVLLKRNAVRGVYRAELPNARPDSGPSAPAPATVYLKVYHDRSLRARLRNLWRGRPAEREWQAALYAERAGIPAVRAAAVCRALPWNGGTASGLLLEGAPGRPLDEYWLALRDDLNADGPRRRAAALRESRDLGDQLARLLARSHQSGFEHVDLHPRNILVHRAGAGGALELRLLDLYGARCGRVLDDDALWRGLAQINQWFRRHSSVSQRLRVLRAYLRWRDEFELDGELGRPIGHDLRRFVTSLDAVADLHQRRLWSKRDQRLDGDGRYFARVRVGGWRGLVHLHAKHPTPDSPASQRRLALDEWQRVLARPLQLLADGPGLCKDSHSARVARQTLPFADGPLEVIVKRPLARDWRRRLRHLLGVSRSRRAWQRAHGLLHRFQPAARPLAMLERRLGPLVLDSLLITEAVPAALDLEAHLRREFGTRTPRGWLAHKRMLAAAVARRIRALADACVQHLDCKAQNLLVVGGGGAGSGGFEGRSGGLGARPLDRPVGQRRDESDPRLIWIDMDGIRLQDRHPTLDQQAAALARLAVSLDNVPGLARSDAVRFLRVYAARDRGPADRRGRAARREAPWRVWWRRIAPLIHDKRAHARRRQAWKLQHYGRT